jgi:SpoU rRNA methylase family enzyme
MSTLDLSDFPIDQAAETVGQLVSLCLRSRRACLLIQRPDGAVTVVDPRVLDAVSDEDMATQLLVSGWSEEDVMHYLSNRR